MKTANPTSVLLVDASVWVVAFNREDRRYPAARHLLGDPERVLAALDLTHYEVANATMRRHGAVPPVLAAIRAVRNGCEERVVAVDPDLVAEATEVALEHQLSAYDAAYVAAARLNGWRLVSFDVADLVSRGLAVLPEDV